MTEPPKRMFTTVPSAAISSLQRRLDAEAYVSGGWGRRRSIESRRLGWRPLGDLARIWQPSRLKGIVTPPGDGLPYLSAGQVFDRSPTPRRWLAAGKIRSIDELIPSVGTILVSRSGTVGRSTVVHSAHSGSLISDDLLRVEARQGFDRGWIYAFTLTDAFRSIVKADQYGHVVKHVEVSHLAAMPVPLLPEGLAAMFDEAVDDVFRLRDRSRSLIQEADHQYEKALATPDYPETPDHFVASSRSFVSGRRRLDAYHHNARARWIEDVVLPNAERVDQLGDVSSAWAPSRFKRAYGPNGVPYRSAEELFAQNPPVTKRIYRSSVSDPDRYSLRRGWLVMACSGQIYGLNGSVMLATEREEGVFASHDLVRIIVDTERVPAGYVLCSLSHRELGRPLVLRHAYGTSIPHIDASDVPTIPVPRIGKELERRIGDLYETSSALRAEADRLEDLAQWAGERVIRDFETSGDLNQSHLTDEVSALRGALTDPNRPLSAL